MLAFLKRHERQRERRRGPSIYLIGIHTMKSRVRVVYERGKMRYTG